MFSLNQWKRHWLLISKGFWRTKTFFKFGVLQVIHSDNGKQFKNKQFEQFLRDRSISQIFTALYSPQANASERVNRTIVTSIRMYVGKDQREWDKHIPEIAESIRSSYHQSIGYAPYFALFGQQMASHGKDHTLFRNLQSLQGETVERNDRLALVRKEIVGNIQKSFEMSAKRYNLRSSNYKFQVGDTVFRRNFVQSDAAKHFTSKFAPKFIKAKVIALKGNSLYQLEDCSTKKIDVYHGKDIKPFRL